MDILQQNKNNFIRISHYLKNLKKKSLLTCLSNVVIYLSEGRDNARMSRACLAAGTVLSSLPQQLLLLLQQSFSSSSSHAMMLNRVNTELKTVMLCSYFVDLQTWTYVQTDQTNK